ncbi:lipoprotein [Geobacter sp. AOG2]|uniref:lipoprotein n=1 Tax=Geobacter sp. AOG2 TaxID=1566347 RepID=UPI001CC434A0|nr:lipoprotein [Geobacter sp. AOG2]GFE59568.1 hypothetical protein AOG2_01560 [Geobacter sp. AOG2]
MKRISGILALLALAGLTGCATKGYVQTQVDPLAERIGKLEAAVSRLNGVTDNDAAAIKAANDKAQQALDLSNKAVVDVVKADGDVRNAEAAAMRAETAALRAEKAAGDAEKAAGDAEKAAGEARQGAQKSEKIFELEQKK